VVERANQYLDTSLLPGRTFSSAADFNTQLTHWLHTRANQRRHAGTHEVPAQALVADRAAMAALPPVAPAVGTTLTTRLGRDYYVNFGGNAYSVDPEMIGRMITVHAELDRITVRCGGLAADHQRLWGTAGIVTDPAHVAAAAVLREQYRTRPTAGRHPEVDVEVADLSAYDAVFGTGEVA
jgi:hypothetical protein